MKGNRKTVRETHPRKLGLPTPYSGHIIAQYEVQDCRETQKREIL